MAPTAMSSPYFSSEELKHTEMTLSLACMMKVAVPSATQGKIRAGRKRTFSFFSRSRVLGPVRNRSTQIQDRALGENGGQRRAPDAHVQSVR